ncbi:MAG: hypothetical protein M3Q06_08835, partial [Bacteroidota bacterium]|nr:hypothetical protein [Bacteroidota bacterium]
MKKNQLLLLLCTLATLFAQAQSKVFKEVSEEISSQIRVIKQDNALVGYLVFTQLEKASEDSFNYQITIMDENLNDIGKVKFRDENLNLQAVSFEQDVICLAYLKSNVIGRRYKNKKDYNNITASPHHAVVTRFLSLDGKTIATNAEEADISISMGDFSYPYVMGKLEQSIQLRNVPQKGFALFFGDNNNNHLLTYDIAGKEVWKKNVSRLAKANYLLSSAEGIYLLSKKQEQKIEGGYEVTGYAFAGSGTYDKYVLKDKKGNALKVLGFDNDPVSGKPYATGMIINPERNGLYTLKDLSKQPYNGVFTINFNGPKKSEIRETFSYWENDKTGLLKENGKFAKSDAYSLFDQGFMDYQGNTYFVGSSVIKKPKWGSIISSVILSPLIVVSPMILVMGTTKCKTTDALVLKQTPDGKLSYDNTIPCNYSSFAPSRAPIVQYGPRKSFYRVTN